ncbi:MAG: hypothetical protein AAFW46_08945 [Pseudomonadota bacterium]
MSALGSFVVRALVGIALTFVTLVFEIVLAFAVYMWLAINHEDLFGWMVQQAGGVLRWAAERIEVSYPDFAVQAYGTLLGELGPKAVLLLFLGLLASGIIRLVRWIVYGMIRRAGLGRGDGL